jgi:hypothetical protein
MLNVIMVSVVMLNVVVLSVVAPIDGNVEYVNNRRKKICLIFFEIMRKKWLPLQQCP